jgi:uncharacterized protein (TIGR02246 family)
MPIPHVIEEVVEAFKRAQLAGDPVAASALFADDAVMYPPVAEAVVRGRPSIDRLLQAIHRRLRILGVDYDQVGGDATSEMAYVHWRYALRAETLAGDAPPITMRGRLLWVLKRRDGGAWRVAVHHASLEPGAASLEPVAASSEPVAPPINSPPVDRP